MSTGYGSIGRYRLINCIYTGQTSRLWQAYDDRARKYVAVKTLLNNFSRDRQQIVMLKWEHMVGSKLESPYIIQIKEFGKDKRIPYIVFEWFMSPNMKQRINVGIDSYAHNIREILFGMGSAVAYLNGQGWLHRDIKPDNFLANDEGEVKLLDFALAKKFKSSGIGKFFSVRGKVQGTPSYMSPEQIRGGKTADSRSDIYSLGCTIYEVLTGKPPFTGENMHDLLTKHLKNVPPPITMLNPNVTPEMAKVLALAMAKRLEDRPSTSDEFAKMLNNTRPLRKIPPKPES